MKILLVYPRYPDTFWSFKHILKFIGKKAAFPPLGLLTVAAMLPNDWEIRLVDVNVKPLLDKDILQADMIFISAMVIQKTSAQEIIDRCKEHGKTVVAGGPAFTAESEKYHSVSHFVLGEAEITLPLFLSDLEKGKAKFKYEQPVGVWADLSQTPIADWSLIDLKDYATMSIQFSRGCPLGDINGDSCEFCDIYILFGTKFRSKTPQQMINEIESLYQAGYRGTIFLADDNPIGNKLRFKEMLEQLIIWQQAHNYPFKFTAQASINLAVEDKIMDLMVRANFSGVFIGIESPDTAALISIGKVVNIKYDLEDAVKRIMAKGLEVMGGFMVGLDGDPPNIFDKLIIYIKQTGIVQSMVGLLVAMPKTKLYKRLMNEGRLIGDTDGDNLSGSLNFVPKMGREKLLAGYRRVLAVIYSSSKTYFKRVDTFLKQCPTKTRGHFSWSDLRPFILSIWHIGLFSRARWYYWRLLIKTGITNYKSYPRAITMAIYWLHFSKIAASIQK
ncbi:MAG: B12-binding domain-containing radical SAM protein [Patescibacteria group bacterium]